MRTTFSTMAMAAMALSATATAALAGPLPAEKCQAAKNQAAGKYAACRQSAEKTFVSTGDSEKRDLSIAKCEANFSKAWQKAVDNAAGAGTTCPDDPLAAADFKSVIDAHSSNIATALGGGELTTADTCGNGTLEAGEACDFGTSLAGQSCSTATAGAAPYGEVSCGAGCAISTSACFGCPGTLYNGACWVVGWEGGSCTEKCTSVGMTYDPATASAGSGSSCTGCLPLAQAMFPGVTSPPYPQPLSVQGTSENGFGCSMWNFPILVCDVAPTLGDAVHPQMERLCACR